jgi:hypothetical protein
MIKYAVIAFDHEEHSAVSSLPAENRSGDDRRRRHRLVYPDRRSGFDRRVPQGRGVGAAYSRMLLAYRRRPVAIFLVLALVTVLNLADLLLTQRALVRGATEVNPIMRFLFDLHPVWAGVVKVSIGMIVVEVIWVFRHHRSALVLSLFTAFGMAALFIYHLVTQKIIPI